MSSHLAYLQWLREADSEDDLATPPKKVATPPWKSKSSAAAQMAVSQRQQQRADKPQGAWWDDLSDDEEEMAEIRDFVAKRRQGDKENQPCKLDGSATPTLTPQPAQREAAPSPAGRCLCALGTRSSMLRNQAIASK